MSCPPSSTVNGSSPLARGRPGAPSSSTRAPGIIPARAGSTHTYQRMVSSSVDHPRSRGVDKRGGRVPPERPGSSPLARGRRGHGYRGLVEDGIIPARAGSTRLCSWPTTALRDHPRSRGVDKAPAAYRIACGGSSPLARGRPNRGILPILGIGIIPARAGSTTCLLASLLRDGDHPRSRGVDGPAVGHRGDAGGSSPLARGRQRLTLDENDRGRIIPARAGSTRELSGAAAPLADHPRSRGVDASEKCVGRPIMGSSPLALGRRLPRTRASRKPRIIPARAGSTIRLRDFSHRLTDHPRSRGVDQIIRAI